MTATQLEPESLVGGGFCRVQIAGPTTRVDLVAAHRGAAGRAAPLDRRSTPSRTRRPEGWALSRLDGTRLDPAAGLASVGIREGELLRCTPAQDSLGRPLYDDVVEVLGDAAAESGWTSRDTRVVCAGLVTLAVLGAAWAGLRSGTPWPASCSACWRC